MTENSSRRRRSLVAVAFAAVAGALTLSACAQNLPLIQAQVMPETGLADLRSFYVRTHDGDRQIGERIAEDLRARGREAVTGTTSTPPGGTQVVVVYTDSWMWDLTMYLLLLRIDFRDVDTDVLLASASSSRPSLVRARPEEMVAESMQAIFDGGRFAVPDPTVKEN